MGRSAAAVLHRLTQLIPRRFPSRRPRTVTALEFNGEWLKLARVEVTAKGKRLLKLVARPVVLQEEIAKILADLFKEGMSSADSIFISIPRNLVTVRNLQLPTTDPHELKEMIGLQAAKQTPYSKEEIIADFQIIKSSPEGYTDVVLITTHRSVSNRCLKLLDDLRLKAAGIRLSSHGVLRSWQQLTNGAPGEEERGPIALLDIDATFSDFLVIRSGVVTFTKSLSIGPGRLLSAEEQEIEKFTEEIQRAIDIYEGERIGPGITKLMVTGAEVRARLIPHLAEKLRLSVQRVSLPRLPSFQGAYLRDVPEAQRGAVSFSAVLGLAWDAESPGVDLTPQEVRMKEALEHKGKAIMVTGILSVSIVAAVTALVSQQVHFKRQYLEALDAEIARTEQGASDVEAVKKKLQLIGGAERLENSSLDILSVLHRSTPPEISIRAITYEEGSHVVLKGGAQRMSTVFEFVSTLENLPNFHQVKAKHASRSGSKEGSEEVEFEITCPLAKKDEAA
jgi:Tfp pilus assembly PilM family ATPase/Tfp pilus assembly protein PilN